MSAKTQEHVEESFKEVPCAFMQRFRIIQHLLSLKYAPNFTPTNRRVIQIISTTTDYVKNHELSECEGMYL